MTATLPKKRKRKRYIQPLWVKLLHGQNTSELQLPLSASASSCQEKPSNLVASRRFVFRLTASPRVLADSNVLSFPITQMVRYCTCPPYCTYQCCVALARRALSDSMNQSHHYLIFLLASCSPSDISVKISYLLPTVSNPRNLLIRSLAAPLQSLTLSVSQVQETPPSAFEGDIRRSIFTNQLTSVSPISAKSHECLIVRSTT